MSGRELRVVSLLPSATDAVVALGMEHLLVGRTHECDWQSEAHPAAAVPVCTCNRLGDIPVADIDACMGASVAALAELQSLGPALAIPLLEFGLSVYQCELAMLRTLRPTVVLTCLQDAHGSVLEGELLRAALLAGLGYEPQVVHCSANDLRGAWRDVQLVADALGASERGRRLVEERQRAVDGAAAACRGRPRPRVACVQWLQPMLAAGAWVPELVRLAGGEDVAGSTEHAAPLSEQRLVETAPEVLVFALCGLPLRTSLAAARTALGRMRGAWRDVPALHAGRVAVVDGERVLSRPGPLLVPSLECLAEMLHPEAQRFGHEGTLWQWLELA